MVVMMTSFALIIGVFLPYSFIGPGLGLTPLPGIYYLFLTLIVVLYIVMISLVKTLYIRKYHELD
jgi:Mg2+-importing ATPase